MHRVYLILARNNFLALSFPELMRAAAWKGLNVPHVFGDLKVQEALLFISIGPGQTKMNVRAEKRLTNMPKTVILPQRDKMSEKD